MKITMTTTIDDVQKEKTIEFSENEKIELDKLEMLLSGMGFIDKPINNKVNTTDDVFLLTEVNGKQTKIYLTRVQGFNEAKKINGVHELKIRYRDMSVNYKVSPEESERFINAIYCFKG